MARNHKAQVNIGLKVVKRIYNGRNAIGFQLSDGKIYSDESLVRELSKGYKVKGISLSGLRIVGADGVALSKLPVEQFGVGRLAGAEADKSKPNQSAGTSQVQAKPAQSVEQQATAPTQSVEQVQAKPQVKAEQVQAKPAQPAIVEIPKVAKLPKDLLSDLIKYMKPDDAATLRNLIGEHESRRKFFELGWKLYLQLKPYYQKILDAYNIPIRVNYFFECNGEHKFVEHRIDDDSYFYLKLYYTLWYRGSEVITRQGVRLMLALTNYCNENGYAPFEIVDGEEENEGHDRYDYVFYSDGDEGIEFYGGDGYTDGSFVQSCYETLLLYGLKNKETVKLIAERALKFKYERIDAEAVEAIKALDCEQAAGVLAANLDEEVLNA